MKAIEKLPKKERLAVGFPGKQSANNRLSFVAARQHELRKDFPIFGPSAPKSNTDLNSIAPSMLDPSALVEHCIKVYQCIT